MLNRVLEEDLHSAKRAFRKAKSETIVEICEKYLTVLSAFRCELHKFRGKIEINLQQSDASLFGDVHQKRREIHAAIMYTIQELNQTTALLKWLTSPSAYESAETFNRLNYKGRENWEFRGGAIGFRNCSVADQIPVREAVDAAIRLRCEEFVLPGAKAAGPHLRINKM